MSGLVSIIMNCHNGAQYLNEALDSIVDQTYKNWEVIFYDNVSTDGSEKIACSYGDKVHFYKNTGKLLSLGAARNEALKNAKGEYIAFLDTDDKWLPDKLKVQIAELEKHPEVGFIYANAWLLREGDGVKTLAYRKIQPGGDVFRSFLRYYPVNLQTVVLRKNVLKKLDHWFDPAFEVSEEFDLFMRLVLKTCAIYIKDPVAIYRVHPAMSSIRNIAKYPVENLSILEKLRKVIPELDLTYSKEVAYFKAKIGYWFASASMQNGDAANARSYLSPHKFTSVVFFLLYLSTYMPIIVWEWFQKLRLKVRVA